MEFFSLISLAETCKTYNHSRDWEDTGYFCYFLDSTEFNIFVEIMKEAKGIKFDYHIPSMSIWFNLE
jgi:hypothetical protein